MMNTAQPQHIPEPIALVVRDGKGCRQYTFDTLDELKAWTERKPYRNEKLLVLPMYGRRFLGRETMPASEAHGYVAKMVSEARQYDDAAASLAAQVLKQAEEMQPECAFWFLSALSKLSGARPHMRVGDVFQFASVAMPTAAKEWSAYAAGTL